MAKEIFLCPAGTSSFPQWQPLPNQLFLAFARIRAQPAGLLPLGFSKYSVGLFEYSVSNHLLTSVYRCVTLCLTVAGEERAVAPDGFCGAVAPDGSAGQASWRGAGRK